MFGEKSIFGNTVIKSDYKNRIILPSFTYAKPDDEVIVSCDSDIIKISNEYYIDNLINEVLLSINMVEDEATEKRLNDKLFKLYESILKKAKVDKQRRIVLTDIVEPETSYKMIGAKDYAYIKSFEKGLK